MRHALFAIAAAIAFAIVPSVASAQWNGPKTGIVDSNGTLIGPGNPQTTRGSTGTPTQAAVTCANTTTLLLAANAASLFIRVVVPLGGTAVGINWAGANATMTPPGDVIQPGNFVSWTTYVPTSQLNCIVASGSQSVTIEYK